MILSLYFFINKAVLYVYTIFTFDFSLWLILSYSKKVKTGYINKGSIRGAVQICGQLGINACHIARNVSQETINFCYKTDLRYSKQLIQPASPCVKQKLAVCRGLCCLYCDYIAVGTNRRLAFGCTVNVVALDYNPVAKTCSSLCRKVEIDLL